MKRKNTLLPITLGLLTAFGPFVTDFYLPALPSMEKFFETSTSAVQMTLTASMMGLGLGQILIGPLSDKYGRTRPLIGAMLLFILATLGCLFSPDIHHFILLRFVQGFAGAGGIVLSKSISTDLFHGRQLTNFMALLGAINGIAPVAAPVIGGITLKFSTWQAIFLILLVIGILLLIMSMALPETLTPVRRLKEPVSQSYINLFKIFKNPTYVLCLAAFSFSMGVLFSYISASPFIFQKHYELNELTFSLFFAINALSIGLGATVTTRFSSDRVCLLTGGIGIIIAACISAALLWTNAPVWAVEGSFALLMLGFGLLQPSLTAMALSSQRQIAGAASAIMGACGFLMGGVVTPMAGLGDIMHSTAICLFLTAFLTFSFSLIIVFRLKKSERIHMGLPTS